MAYIEEGINEYGTPETWFKCDSCGLVFSVVPAVAEKDRWMWDGCLGDNCDSYDPARDISIFWDALVDNDMIEVVPAEPIKKELPDD